MIVSKHNTAVLFDDYIVNHLLRAASSYLFGKPISDVMTHHSHQTGQKLQPQHHLIT
jgi:hypothetical protein